MIAILTPSRGRPDRFNEMVDAIHRTAWGDVEIYCGLDDDDHESYLLPVGVKCLIRPRMQLAAWTNVLAEQAIADGATILASFGDDHRPRTAGWDETVTEAFDRHGSGLIYTRDGLQDERLPTAPFWSADVIQALGWYFPPAQKHLYADDFWLAFARALDRCHYLPDVLIEHLHPSSGKSEADAINEDNDSHYDADRQAFEAYLADGFEADVARVKAAL